MAVGRIALVFFEVVILSGLILITRCANYHDVFVAGNIYFSDADCYSRMTRVRLCAAHPGLIIRHHDFENYPNGTTPHTTAPLDYLILGLSILLKPFSAHAVNLAGALISPFFGLASGWFLWWWSRMMKFRYRWTMLILFAISPILVHGTELGRPDHQSLLMLLVTIGICGEWSFQSKQSTGWSVLAASAWGFALWVSTYEPLLLLVLLVVISLAQDRRLLFAKTRRPGWIAFLTILAIALAIEQRLPSLSIFHSTELFKNWSQTIGELHFVSLRDPIWFHWAGYLIVVAPILIWLGYRRQNFGAADGRVLPIFVAGLLIATFGLTIWQARWGYFFISIFVVALPALLESIKSRTAVWFAFTLSVLPVLRDLDQRFWPNETTLAGQLERRNESVQLRELAILIRSTEIRPFLAPWWLSPEIAYWSEQPGVAGSSHESLDGIIDSARFFVADKPRDTREILDRRKVFWVFAYDSDRVTTNSAALLGLSRFPQQPLSQTIDRAPSQAPLFLVFSGQNATAKLFRVVNKR